MSTKESFENFLKSKNVNFEEIDGYILFKWNGATIVCNRLGTVKQKAIILSRIVIAYQGTDGIIYTDNYEDVKNHGVGGNDVGFMRTAKDDSVSTIDGECDNARLVFALDKISGYDVNVLGEEAMNVFKLMGHTAVEAVTEFGNKVTEIANISKSVWEFIKSK
jgi:hypothetical protein